MGKQRNTYRTYTTNVLKTRSEIPAQVDISEQSGYIDCVNISLNAVKGVLSASTYSLYDLCRHANVNHWSAFGPTVRSTSGSDYAKECVNSDPTVCKLGDFAGYNHGAVTPGWQTGGQATAEANNWVNSGSQATCNANIDIGEVDWENEMGAVGVAMLIFDVTDNITGWGYTVLSGVGSNFTLSGETTIGGGIVVDKLDWYAMAFLVDQTITDPADVISAVVCRVPNISTWEINLKVKVAIEWHYDETGTQTIPSPWTQNGTAGMNWTTGYFDIGMIATNNNYTNLKIYARLFNWEYTQVGSDAVIYNTSYTALDDITGSASVGMTDIPAYGYHVIVYFEYTV